MGLEGWGGTGQEKGLRAVPDSCGAMVGPTGAMRAGHGGGALPCLSALCQYVQVQGGLRVQRACEGLAEGLGVAKGSSFCVHPSVPHMHAQDRRTRGPVANLGGIPKIWPHCNSCVWGSGCLLGLLSLDSEMQEPRVGEQETVFSGSCPTRAGSRLSLSTGLRRSWWVLQTASNPQASPPSLSPVGLLLLHLQPPGLCLCPHVCTRGLVCCGVFKSLRPFAVTAGPKRPRRHMCAHEDIHEHMHT